MSLFNKLQSLLTKSLSYCWIVVLMTLIILSSIKLSKADLTSSVTEFVKINNQYSVIQYMLPDYRQYKSNQFDPSIYNQSVQCLAKNIYFEARSQTIQGMIAVGLVTINRVLSNKFPDNICDVVWQKKRSTSTGKWSAQFSWTLDGKSDNPVNQKYWVLSQNIASTLLYQNMYDNIYDFTQGATHYHADYVQPYWSKHLKVIFQIDNHVFYSEPL